MNLQQVTNAYMLLLSVFLRQTSNLMLLWLLLKKHHPPTQKNASFLLTGNKNNKHKTEEVVVGQLNSAHFLTNFKSDQALRVSKIHTRYLSVGSGHELNIRQGDVSSSLIVSASHTLSTPCKIMYVHVCEKSSELALTLNDRFLDRVTE